MKSKLHIVLVCVWPLFLAAQQPQVTHDKIQLPPEASESWYAKAMKDIAASEYNIQFSEANCGLRSHNRQNNFYIDLPGGGFTLTPKGENEVPVRFIVQGIYTQGKKTLPADVIGYEYKNKNNLVFWHHGFKEQYINTPDGLRQNFIIEKNLHDQEIRLLLQVEGAIATAPTEGQINLRTSRGTLLHYKDLNVWDAKGRSLAANMQLLPNNQIALVVTNAQKAAYPITIDPLSTTAVTTAESNQASALFGRSVASAGDVNGDGFSDVVIGAPYYDNGLVDEGAAFIYHGSPAGLSVSAFVIIEGNQAGEHLGIAVAGAGDVNGDGYSDVIIGANLYTNGESEEGAVFVYHGSANGISPIVAWQAEGNQTGAEMGVSVASAGDVNGDGYSDVIVGAWNYDNGQTDEGAAFIYHGSISGLGLLSTTIDCNQPNSEFGYSVAGAGDVNGDGYSDIIIGASQYDNGQSNEGAAFIYHGGANGISTTTAAMVESDQGNANLGWSVASSGDVNGDGYSDIIVGAINYDNGTLNEGAAFVYHGSAIGISTSTFTIVESNALNAQLGYSVNSAGDFNGDGYSDVIIGANAYESGSSSYVGSAYLYQGSASGLITTAVWQIVGSQAFENLGNSVASAGDVNGDGYGDVIVGAYRYDNGQTDEGAAFVYHGSASGISTTAATTLESNQASALFGISVASAGDVNGDGYSDVIVGAYSYDNSQTNEGAAFVYHGSASGLSTAAAATLESNQASALFGISVASAGDVNGDGYSDVIVGAHFYNNGETDEGAAFVYHGSANGISTTASTTLESNQANALFGHSVASAGDVNGDGYCDVIVGADLFNAGQTHEGAAFVYHGSASGISTMAATTLEVNQAGAIFGHSVASAGDVNGDGFSDVIVGAYSYDKGQTDEGAAFVYYGGASGITTTTATTLESNQASSRFGLSVANAGDVNGDGYSDVIVGAYLYDKGDTDEGAAFVYHGSATGLSTTAATTLESNQASANLGSSVASAGDVNGDGYSDVIVGAYLYDNGQTDEGAAFVYHGSATGISTTAAATLESDQANAHFAYGVANAGDVNGDGYSDVIVGAYSYDKGQTDEGAAFVYHGNTGGGLRNNVQALDDNLSGKYTTLNSLCDNGFGLALFNKSPMGRVKGTLQVETITQAQTWGSGTKTTGSLADLSTGGSNQTLAVNYLPATVTRARVRQKFDPVTAIDGRIYGPWRYLQNVQSPAALSGFYGGDVIVWNGTNWCKGSGAAAAPGADGTKRLLIHGNSATLTEDATVAQLQINWAYTASVEPDISLAVSGEAKNYNTTAGSFAIKANTTANVGSYIGPQIENAELQYGIVNAGWHNVSIPFAINATTWQAQNAPGTVAITGVAATQNLQRYNTTLGSGSNNSYNVGSYSSFASGQWQLPNGTEILNANGYNFFVDNYFGGTPQIIVARGTTQDVTFNYTLYNANGGINMVPNPYPATLDLSALYSANSTEMDPGIYIWDAASSNYVAIDASTGLAVDPDLGVNTNSTYAAAGQAFYVRPKDYNNTAEAANSTVTTSTKTLTITPAMRSTTSARLYKNEHVISLKATHGSTQKTDQLAIFFDQDYNDEFTKGEDIEKFFSLNDDAISIFASAAKKAMAIAKYQTPVAQTTIPIGFDAKQNGVIEISLLGMPEGWSIFLKDYKTGAIKNLGLGSYNFANDPTFGPDRFALTVSKTDQNLIETAGVSEQPIVFVSQGELQVYTNKNAGEAIELAVLNMAGQIMYTANFVQAAPVLKIDLQATTGLYMVQVRNTNTGKTFNNKIFWP